MKPIFVCLLLWLSLLAFGQQPQPVYVPPQKPVAPALPKADPVPTKPAPQAYTTPSDVRPTDPNRVDAVPSRARSNFEAEMQSQQKGSTQRTTSAQPADFDSIPPVKDPEPQVQPPPIRN